MKVEILGENNGIITLKLHDEYDNKTLEKNAYKGRYFAYLEPLIKDTTTDEQRKHYWALIGDIHDYTGDPKWKIVLNMKYLYMIQHDKTKEPSMARNKMKMSDARALIQTIIDYCLENEIPLQNNYLSQMDEKQLFGMTMKRICWVCGKQPADLHHQEGLVQMGRDRTKVDHSKSKFVTLCRSCHIKAHQMGLKTFEETYHFKPISLSKDNLKDLGVN